MKIMMGNWLWWKLSCRITHNVAFSRNKLNVDFSKILSHFESVVLRTSSGCMMWFKRISNMPASSFHQRCAFYSNFNTKTFWATFVLLHLLIHPIPSRHTLTLTHHVKSCRWSVPGFINFGEKMNKLWKYKHTYNMFKTDRLFIKP